MDDDLGEAAEIIQFGQPSSAQTANIAWGAVVGLGRRKSPEKPLRPAGIGYPIFPWCFSLSGGSGAVCRAMVCRREKSVLLNL